MTELYYQAPPGKQFEELKKKAIEVWQEFDDTYGYATKKIDQIKNLKNIGDNFMSMVAVFDVFNQLKLARKLTPKTRKAVADRIKDGGTPDIYNVFIAKKK